MSIPVTINELKKCIAEAKEENKDVTDLESLLVKMTKESTNEFNNESTE